MNLPDEIEREKWNVILIDGPNENEVTNPDQMKAIFLSCRLAKLSGRCFCS